MRFIIALFICFSTTVSQVDSIYADSILRARIDLLVNSHTQAGKLRMTFEDSMRPIWKSTFGSQSGELDIISEHLKNRKYDRNFVGISVLNLGYRLLEWIGLKKSAVNENGNSLDIENELYNEEIWKQRIRDKIALDSVKLLLKENN